MRLTRGNKAQRFNILIGVVAGLLAALIASIIASILHLPNKIALLIVIGLGIGLAILICRLMRKRPLLISKIAAIVLLIMGVIILLSSYNKSLWSQIIWDRTAVGVGVGIISISIAAFALNVSLESDERMRAMANLEFYEKISVIEHYIAQVQANHDIPAEAIYNDIKGAMQLKKYVDDPIYKKLNKEINKLKKIAKKDHEQYQELIKKLTKLQKEDTPHK